MDTDILLMPMAEKLSRTDWVMPLPRPTMTITAVTPMMMPSMVRMVRILLLPDVLERQNKGIHQEHGLSPPS